MQAAFYFAYQFGRYDTMKHMINTVIFDLSEVFFHGLKGTEALINTTYKPKVPLVNPVLMNMKEATQLFHGEITEDVYWDAVIRDFQIHATVSDLKGLVRKNFREIPGTRDVAKTLKHNGYTLGLLSVNVREWITYCDNRFDFNRLFDARVYSYEVAVSKPDKKAYKIIVDKLRVTSEECLFIDDSKPNLISAESLGMTTVQFTDANTLKEELQTLGIKV